MKRSKTVVVIMLVALAVILGLAWFNRQKVPPRPYWMEHSLDYDWLNTLPADLSTAQFVRYVSYWNDGSSHSLPDSETQVFHRLRWMYHVPCWYRPTPASIPVLRRAMENETIDVAGRLCIARYLLDFGDEPARIFVKDCLYGEHKHAMFNAAEALAWRDREQDGWSSQLMLELLQDDRLDAWYESDAPADGTGSPYGNFCLALGKARYEKAVPVLIERLKNSDLGSSYRWLPADVINALLAIGDARAIEPLKTYAAEGDPQHRLAARLAVIQLASEDVVADLLELLNREQDFSNKAQIMWTIWTSPRTVGAPGG